MISMARRLVSVFRRPLRVAVGISGGVDSAVAAARLVEHGHDVIGCHITSWDWQEERGECSGEADKSDARWVCEQLKIPMYSMDAIREYWCNVWEPTIEGYVEGSTPNPDLLCNQHIKLGVFVKETMEKWKVDAVATGHFARVRPTQGLPTQDGSDWNWGVGGGHPVQLLRGVDTEKDQSYFLALVDQDKLRYALFPCGGDTKGRIRQEAVERGLWRVASKKSTSGVCMVGPSGDFGEFLEEYVEHLPGSFVDIENGRVLGNHKGWHRYTIGQRARISGAPQKYYVVDKKGDCVMVAAGWKHPALYMRWCETASAFWIDGFPPKERLWCVTRYRETPLACRVMQQPLGRLRIEFEDPARAITVGQAAVLYSEDGVCWGGGIVDTRGPTLWDEI